MPQVARAVARPVRRRVLLANRPVLVALVVFQAARRPVRRVRAVSRAHRVVCPAPPVPQVRRPVRQAVHLVRRVLVANRVNRVIVLQARRAVRSVCPALLAARRAALVLAARRVALAPPRRVALAARRAAAQLVRSVCQVSQVCRLVA